MNRAKYLHADNITFKHAQGVSDKSGKEFHTYHEIILFLGGKADFISENLHTPLEPNTLIVIPAETYHQLSITGPQSEYHRCVFHFTDIAELSGLIGQSMTGVRLIKMNQRLQFLFERMYGLLELPAAEPVLIKSTLSLLLHEIRSSHDLPAETADPGTVPEKCIAYISKHLTEPIGIETVARELNVSVSHLAHTFKNQMNISVHKYILKKRLIMAHHRIRDGVPATQAAVECGFNDYSGFYKQFKKMFGRSPSAREADMIWEDRQ